MVILRVFSINLIKAFALAIAFVPEDMFFVCVLAGRLLVFAFYIMLFVR